MCLILCFLKSLSISWQAERSDFTWRPSALICLANSAISHLGEVCRSRSHQLQPLISPEPAERSSTEPLVPSQKKHPKEAVLSAWVDLTCDGAVSPQCHHTVRGEDASCHSTVGMWILHLQDFCPFLSLGRLLRLEPHPRARISGTRLCFQPRAWQRRAVDPQAGPRVRVWAGAASTSQNTAPFPWKPAPPISNSSAANVLRLLV